MTIKKGHALSEESKNDYIANQEKNRRALSTRNMMSLSFALRRTDGVSMSVQSKVVLTYILRCRELSHSYILRSMSLPSS